MPPFTVDVSCHTVNEARFDWFTQVPGSYRAFLRGMTLLRESSLPFTLKTKLMNWNQDELNALRMFTESFGRSFSYTTSISPRLDGDCSSLAYRILPENLQEIGRSEIGAEQQEPCDGDPLLDSPGHNRLFVAGAARTRSISMPGESSAPARSNTKRAFRSDSSPCGRPSTESLRKCGSCVTRARPRAGPVASIDFVTSSRHKPDGKPAARTRRSLMLAMSPMPERRRPDNTRYYIHCIPMLTRAYDVIFRTVPVTPAASLLARKE